MNRIAITTALLVGLSAPAFANEQLAASIGVQPGTYSNAELAILKSQSDKDAFATIGAYTNRAVVSTQSGVSAGSAQFAASVGVEPGTYSNAELAILKSQNDKDAFATIGAYTDRSVVSTQSGISTGHAQLAAGLGLDPATYSVSDLARIKFELEDDNRD